MREFFKLTNSKERRGSYSSKNINRVTKWEWRVAFIVEIRKAYSGGKTQCKETAWKIRARW